MNKPDESTLISYLYGELDAKEMQTVSDYLERNPELMQQLAQLQATRHALTRVEDKEVIAPPIFAEESNHAPRFWQSGYFKTVTSIAATFLLLLVAARLLGPDISYSEGELRISFRDALENKPLKETPSPLSPLEVQNMIDVSLNKNNTVLSATWNNHNDEIQASLKRNLAYNSAKIDELMKVASQASQDQVRTFVAGLQEDNLRLMKDYMQLSAKDQKVYVENLLVDFSKYLQEQRKQDLMLFQTRMSSIEKNTDQFKQETELILASIISGPENSLKKVSNY